MKTYVLALMAIIVAGKVSMGNNTNGEVCKSQNSEIYGSHEYAVGYQTFTVGIDFIVVITTEVTVCCGTNPITHQYGCSFKSEAVDQDAHIDVTEIIENSTVGEDFPPFEITESSIQEINGHNYKINEGGYDVETNGEYYYVRVTLIPVN